MTRLVQWTVLLILACAGCGDDERAGTSDDGQGTERKDAGTGRYQDCESDSDCSSKDGICRNNRCTHPCSKPTTKPDPGCPASARGFPVWCTTHDDELWCEEILL